MRRERGAVGKMWAVAKGTQRGRGDTHTMQEVRTDFVVNFMSERWDTTNSVTANILYS